ncbi:unnamed protein product [Chrysoparadoxa australica]
MLGRFKLCSLFLGVALSIRCCVGSFGDRQSQYQTCRKRCILGCRRDGSPVMEVDIARSLELEQYGSKQPEWAARLLNWDCKSDCGYLCMWDMELTRRSAVRNRPHTSLKYHGKWPFLRVWGMQEVCSVVFSLGNCSGHLYNLLRPQWPMQHPLRPWLIAYSAVAVVMWLSSAAFHSRDTPWTEKADYFSAQLAIIFTVIIMVQRLLTPSNSLLRRVVMHAVSLSLGCFWCWHCAVMMKRFDYGQNMKVALTLAAVHGLLLLIHLRRRTGMPHVGMMKVTWVCFHAAIALEVLDFEPLWDLVDAHSLWHACTMPLVWMWYSFMIKDLHADAEMEMKRNPSKKDL